MQRWGLALQARLGSSRLPGKVLEDLGGKPMLERIFQQVSAADASIVPILTTSLDPKDDRLCEFAESAGWKISRAPADDIIGRLNSACVDGDVDVLIRVWGDCPFVCPDIVTSMVTKFKEENLEFLTNGTEARTLPIGLDLEIYGHDLLRRADREVKDVFLREFPVQFVLGAQPPVRWAAHTPSSAFPMAHLTVDYPEDLQAARAIYERLSRYGQTFTSSQLFHTLSAEPQLLELFAHRPRQADFAQKLEEFKKRTAGNKIG